MPVPAIALYASPPSSVCSTPHPCQINAHASYDFELSSRPSSSASSTLSTSQKPVIGGISCLFSSPTVRSSSSFPGGGCGEELSSYSVEGKRRCRGKGLLLQGKRRKRTKEELKVKISSSSSSSSAFFFQCKYRREKEKEESWGDLAVMVQKTEWGHFWK